MQLSDLRTLGRSGLPVSPLALGAMTFGNKKWGSPDDVSSQIFKAYVEAGGNFIDTADVYAGGRSEELLGGYIEDLKLRDKIVLATKFSFNGGNGRKNIYRALEGSLKRLQTDYVDLYWMHVWDRVTPVEELLQSLGDLVRAGKIRYFGFSDMPAWYTARAVTLAQDHSVPGPIAMQLAYSLIERTIEQEHIPAARELGLGITPWSPLGFGFLTGRYTRGDDGKPVLTGGRISTDPTFQNFSERNWRVLEALQKVSEAAGKPIAQIALAWASAQPLITSLILGASKLEQLHENLASLTLQLSTGQLAELNQASALEPALPYSIFSDQVSRGIFGGLRVQGWN